MTRTRELQAEARESQNTPFASPYYFEGAGTRRSIRMNDSWRIFLMENMGVVLAFAEHHFALYLQARNPNVPGVVNKLCAPTARQLTVARDFWRLVRTDFEKNGKPAEFRDIYSERQLGDCFSIDHFLPWSFVVHDLLWNLTPVEVSTNSSKNDVLPDLDLYLPRLAKLHFAAIETAKKRPKFLEDYTDCFKLDVPGLLALGKDGLEGKYREVIAPQAQIATNLGFQPGWKIRSGTIELFSTRKSAEAEAMPAKVQQAFSEESKPQLPAITASPEPDDVTSSESVIVQFPEQGGKEFSQTHLPYYSLKVAAGGFIPGDAPPVPEGWVNVVASGFSRRSFKGMFATMVVGKSMEPTINDGALCVFRSPVEGSRQGRVVLVQKRHFSDPETGGNFTVKRYRSTKVVDEDGWRHDVIELIPDNLDRQKYPLIRLAPEDQDDLRIVAEFVAMLDLKSEKLRGEQ